jgi:nitrous oxidase accessory protein NosD
MKHKLTISTLLALALFLTLPPTIMGGTTWYVNGVHGSDSNNCMSFTTACKTIGHAISLAHPGDTFMVAAATYSENLTISKSLTISGSGAATTIIDGGRAASMVTIPNTGTSVTLSKMTIRNGRAARGGGVYNKGELIISESTVSGNIASPTGTQTGSSGGGIYNSGILTITNTTISGNGASGTPLLGMGAEAFTTSAR